MSSRNKMPQALGKGEREGLGEVTPHISFRPQPHAYHQAEELQKRKTTIALSIILTHYFCKKCKKKKKCYFTKLSMGHSKHELLQLQQQETMAPWH